jgi:hypothetical protein
MGTYEAGITIPVPGQPIGASGYGIPVRDAIIDLDRRLLSIESTLSNYALKVGATIRASNVTPTADPDLQLYLQAGAKYFVEMFLSVAALNTADFQTQWIVPTATSTISRRVFGPAANLGSTYGLTSTNEANADAVLMRHGVHNWATTVPYNGVRNSATNTFQIQENGIVTTTTDPGYVALAWSQVTSIATGTQVSADSFMRATKIG